ncbi:membrane protein [Longimycelium tulufanense]|uniref:Membrane protein n=1 Tax=Longimycelium tulufanense TaxID=907463 RepID=A0A8J3FSE4_9PSEU|nr:membrane protein [Longimycelium tulufanense]
MEDRAGLARSGLVLALLSAGFLGASGPFGKALITAGMSPVQAVWVRIAGSALVLVPVVVLLGRASWDVVRRNLPALVLYGLLAVAGVQGFYFLAVSRIPVGVALLLEYLAPVLIVLWVRFVRRSPVPRSAAWGAAAVVIGLACVVQIWAGLRLDVVGLSAGLAAAVCQASFFLLSDRLSAAVDPLTMFACGTTVAAVALAPFARPWSADWSILWGSTMVAGHGVWTPLVVLWVVVVSTVLAYTIGILAIRRLSAPVAGVIASTEVLFAVLIAWIALGETLTLIQVVGGAVLLAGAFVAQRSVPSTQPEVKRPAATVG